MRHRDTVEVMVGGVLGPIKRPEVVIAGRYRGDELVMVGRTVPLTDAQSADWLRCCGQLAEGIRGRTK